MSKRKERHLKKIGKAFSKITTMLSQTSVSQILGMLIRKKMNNIKLYISTQTVRNVK